MLFLIITEELSRATLEAKITGATARIKVGKDISLSHLLFVDDILLFLKGSLREAKKVKEIMDLYSTATGMKVNVMKSIISFSGVNDETEKKVLQIFPFRCIGFMMDSNIWGFH